MLSYYSRCSVINCLGCIASLVSSAAFKPLHQSLHCLCFLLKVNQPLLSMRNISRGNKQYNVYCLYWPPLLAGEFSRLLVSDREVKIISPTLTAHTYRTRRFSLKNFRKSTRVSMHSQTNISWKVTSLGSLRWLHNILTIREIWLTNDNPDFPIFWCFTDKWSSGRSSFSIDTLLALKYACHSKTCVKPKEATKKVCRSNPMVSVAKLSRHEQTTCTFLK